VISGVFSLSLSCSRECYCCWETETLCGGSNDKDARDRKGHRNESVPENDNEIAHRAGVGAEAMAHNAVAMAALASKLKSMTATTRNGGWSYYYAKGTGLLRAKKMV
jgi:hypothetical protein